MIERHNLEENYCSLNCIFVRPISLRGVDRETFTFSFPARSTVSFIYKDQPVNAA